MGPSGPVIADTVGFIDLTDDTLPVQLSATPNTTCGFFELQIPRETGVQATLDHDVDVSAASDDSLSSSRDSGELNRPPPPPPAAEVIDVDELSDGESNGNSGLSISPGVEPSASAQDEDVLVTFARRRRPQLPQPRPMFRLSEPTLRAPGLNNVSFGPNSNSGPTSVRGTPIWTAQGQSEVPIDLDNASLAPLQSPTRLSSPVIPNRTTVEVGGGFGSNLSRRRVTTVNSPHGLARVVIPLPHDYQHPRRQAGHYVLPAPRPRARAQRNTEMEIDAEQIGRFRRGFMANRPENFVRPDLDYGEFLRHLEYPGYNWDFFADGMFAEVAEAMARSSGGRPDAGTYAPTSMNITVPEVAPPTKGFTRKVRTGTKLVCPECNAVLGAPAADAADAAEEGGERPKDIQRTIWAAKCGHVYCGSCAAKYRRTTRRNRKDKVGICVALDCRQNITGKGMFELFP